MDAEAYDQWFDTNWGRHAFQIELSALEAAAGPFADLNVLDVGCGTGRFTAALSRQAGWTTGIDRDAAMLAVASTRFSGPLLIADADHLPYRANAFDVTFAITLCEFTPNPQDVVAEMARVTKPRGLVVIGALNRRSPWGIMRRKRLQRPPWSRARFFRGSELLSLGRPHGRASVTGALFAPGISLPTEGVSTGYESIAKRLVSACGAFQVLSVIVERD
jgi:ubiquinone/menaquinone biosynthesis C-methylase UbiE